MKKSINLPRTKEDDYRPAHFRRIGNELRREKNRDIWYDLSQDDMSDLLVVEGDKMVPGANEVVAIQSGLNEHCKRLRDGCRFEVRLVENQHQMRYARYAIATYAIVAN